LRRAARRAAEAGDTTDFNTLLNQVRFNRKEDRQKLKNALVKGDVARNLKNLWAKIKKHTDAIAAPFEKGMGNQKPQNTTTTTPSQTMNTTARQI